MFRTRRRTLLAIFIAFPVLICLASIMYQTVHQPTPEPPVIIVGSGLAGLSVAYTALTDGGASNVVLLERSAKPGGNSIKASSGINGASTRFQPETAVPDTDFYSDTVRSAGSRLAKAQDQRLELISTLVKGSNDAIEFLTKLGVDLSVVTQLGGHSRPRTHRGAGKLPPGVDIVKTLLAQLDQFGPQRFQLVVSGEVTRLLTDGSKVTGVEYKSESGETHSLLGPVVFASGGFAGDAHGLLAQYRPDLNGMPSTNDDRPGMHKVLSDIGAKLVDMDSVQIHPTGFVDSANPQARVKFLAAEMLRGEGGILLHEGKRFVNELDTREHISKRIMELPPAKEDGELHQWDIKILLDPGAVEAASAHIGFYVWKGLMQKKKVRDLDETTRQTLKEYSKVVSGGEDSFGRRAFGHWKLRVTEWDDDAEVCIGRVTPVAHFTMGGVAINDHAQVLSSDLGEEPVPISGLWAAGEITGGLHGDNRLGGSSLLECVVFGRIAGMEAAKLAQQKI